MPVPETMARDRSADLPAAVLAGFPGDALTGWLRARDRLRGAGYGSAVPRAFERSSVALAPLTGAEAATALADAVSTVAIRATPRIAERLCAVAEIAGRRMPEAFGDWLALIRRLAALAPESVAPLLDNMEMLTARLDLPGLEAWIMTGLRLGGRDADKRQSYFRLETPEALRLLELEAGGDSFVSMERRLRAYLTALYDITPPLRIAPPAGRQGAARRTSFAGGVLLVPPSLPGYRGAAEPLYRAALAHIGAHLRYSGRFPVGQLKPLQIAVVSLIEDARVELLAAREMPGLLRLWRTFHVARPGGLATAPSLFARLARALIDPDFDDPDGWIRKGRAMFLERRERWSDPAISREIGNLLGNDLGQLRVQFNAKDYVVQPAYRDDNLGLWDLGEDPPQDAEALEVMVDTVKLRRSDPAPGEAERQEQQAPAEETVEKVAPMAGDTEEGRVLASYPEYDYATGRERADWATVKAYPAAPGNPRFWEELREARGPLLSRVAGLIRSAEVGQARRQKRQAEGEVLDLDACIDAATALRSGQFPDHRVYERQAPPQRNLAVSLLLDISQSTADPVPGTDRTVLDIERDAAAVLAHAMDEMGDPFAINAFSSDGREEVRLTPIKSFDAPLDAAVGAALSGLRPGYSTRLGAALRHAGAELARVPRHRRLLLLITDGEPSDIDCPDPVYLVQDARRAVQGLAALGIDVFCVGLGPRNKEQEAAIFGGNGFIQIDRVSALPDKLPALYLRMVR
ncbi:nitric oxide reductase activation protein NorD [Pseudodonghicola flavimaris]|uniref:VWA domain-containing protein n=1 Tax=Pseudodonghicola flavimaris TaxID=3050036 RepID=A0ABT7F0C7_9RHOB|nr:VWA domain-containing protein [Pseudodonghicola flavimaris]MDK3018047.1 VWA domain-containing protein [Pseudodonghicola flavimaris]